MIATHTLPSQQLTQSLIALYKLGFTFREPFQWFFTHFVPRILLHSAAGLCYYVLCMFYHSQHGPLRLSKCICCDHTTPILLGHLCLLEDARMFRLERLHDLGKARYVQVRLNLVFFSCYKRSIVQLTSWDVSFFPLFIQWQHRCRDLLEKTFDPQDSGYRH